MVRRRYGVSGGECTQLRDDGTWLGKLGSVESSVVSTPSKGWHIRVVLILGPGFL